MNDWWLLGALIAAVIASVFYRKWSTRRLASMAAGHVMTKTADGEPLQFLVRATRRPRGKSRQ